MKRRELLGAAVVAALPWRRLRAATGWRTFEVATRAEISRAQGVSRAWLPLPLNADTDWQRALGNTWTGNAKRIEEVRAGKYGVPMLYAEWAPGEAGPFVELKSRFSTRDRAVDLSRKDAAPLSRAEFFAEGIGWVPVDPADVRKVILEEPPGQLSLQDAKVEAARKRLFGSWEMNWVAFNSGHDLELPGSSGPKLPFLMYPN